MSQLPHTARFLRFMLRHNIRGQTRLLYAMTKKIKSLQVVPIEFADRPPVYVELPDGWNWLQGSPWATAPDEINEQQLIKRVLMADDVVYDIGANIGLYTSLFAALRCTVVAFEPNPRLLRVLQLTVAGLANVIVSPLALSDTSGTATLYVPNDNTMGSLADYTRTEELTEWKDQIGLNVSETMRCQTATLDSCIDSGFPRPDFIKCDVEGAELMVFRGAKNTLGGPSPPLILFEVLEMCSNGFGVDKFAATDFVKGLGYELFDVYKNGTLRPMTPSGERVNVLAVPKERLKRVSSLVVH